ncbi:MAG: polyhydroxyalkanoate depolymerase, partial [Sphingomonas sp.]
MLYGAYEMQRSMLAGASAMANFSAGLLNNPANPFAYFGGGPVLASALEVFAHAAAPRGKPAFNLSTTVIDGRTVSVHEEIVARKPFGQLKRFVREGV